MAQLLYRLGRFSARRALWVLGFWLVMLAAAATAFLTLGGTLASSFDIPGTPTAKVTDELKKELPDLNGMTGTVVFTTTDGAKLTAAQQKAITAVLASIKGSPDVRAIVDPFAAQQQIADANAKIADGEKQIATAQTRLDQGQQQLDAGKTQLNAAIAQAKSAGAYEAAKAQFDAQQAQLDAQQQKLDAGKAQLATQSMTLQDGKGLAALAAKLRTVSADGTTAVGAVEFTQDLYHLAPSSKSAVGAKLDAANIPGVAVTYSTEIANAVGGVIGLGEVIGVIVAALVLIVVLRALLGAILPLVSSLIGVGIGVAGAMAFSGLVSMSAVTPVLGVMLGLAVGIDYSLFIINRHRRQLRAGMELEESIGLADGTAGGAVLFAGLTVVVALLALNVTTIPFLGLMGDVGAACVAIAVLIAISLTPALLKLFGTRVLTRKQRAHLAEKPHVEKPLTATPIWRAILTAVLAIAALLVVALPATSMRLGLPDGSQDAVGSTSYKTFETIAAKFGAGQNGAVLVTARLPKAVAADGLTAAELAVAKKVAATPDVVAVAPVGVNASRDYIAFQVVPVDGPASESTERLTAALRALSPLSDGTVLGVAGEATSNIDISAKLAAAVPIYLAVVIGLSLIIMIIVFRSLLVPIIATAGYVLSLFAALGAVVAVFQWGWAGALFGVHDPGPVLNFAPIILMGVLFGLAMDYQLFVVSGMREAFVHGESAARAVSAGVRGARAVVSAAAIIMVSVFGGFIFSDLTMVRPLGFGMAFGVLLDAFVVRLLLVPAVMRLLGRSAWWIPRWLDRILPNVDVEGAALERTHPLH